jgi:transcriptional regulator with XRE-family HTH domain
MRENEPKSTHENTLRSVERAIEKLVENLPVLVIASRLKRARMAQGLSVRNLAEAAGLSKNSITRLEQGKEVRSITILKVCSALGLHIERLAEPEVQDSAAIHRHTDDRWYDLTDFGAGPLGGQDRPLTSEEREGFVRQGIRVPLLLLKSRLSQGKLLPTVLELYHKSESRSHPGEEFVYVLKGAARITIGDREYVLSEGESMDFWASELHSYAPADKTPAVILSVRVNP